MGGVASACSLLLLVLIQSTGYALQLITRPAAPEDNVAVPAATATDGSSFAAPLQSLPQL